MKRKIKRFGWTLKACFLLWRVCFCIQLALVASRRHNPPPSFHNHTQIIRGLNQINSQSASHVTEIWSSGWAQHYHTCKQATHTCEKWAKLKLQKHDKVDWKTDIRFGNMGPWQYLFAYLSRFLIKYHALRASRVPSGLSQYSHQAEHKALIRILYLGAS